MGLNFLLRVGFGGTLAERVLSAKSSELAEASTPFLAFPHLGGRDSHEDAAASDVSIRPPPPRWGRVGVGVNPAQVLSALEGVKVLDLCIVLAGPTCGRTMAEFGADVIRIDSPHTKTHAAATSIT